MIADIAEKCKLFFQKNWIFSKNIIAIPVSDGYNGNKRKNKRCYLWWKTSMYP